MWGPRPARGAAGGSTGASGSVWPPAAWCRHRARAPRGATAPRRHAPAPHARGRGPVTRGAAGGPVRPSGATAVTARPPAAILPVGVARGARRAAPRGPPVALVDGWPPAGVGRPPRAPWGEHWPRRAPRPPRPDPQDARSGPWAPRGPPRWPPEGQGGLVAHPELGAGGGGGPLARLRTRPGGERRGGE